MNFSVWLSLFKVLISVSEDSNNKNYHILPHFLIKKIYFIKKHINSQFSQFLDLIAVDQPKYKKRFLLKYIFLSYLFTSRIQINIFLAENQNIFSLTSLFNSSNWLEREVWDLFGIFFSNHPDLRRILTDYGFEGFPLRKDFPLIGYFEFRFDDLQKLVISEVIELTQEFRFFNFTSPWEK